MEIDVEETFKGFHCQVQHAENAEIDPREGIVSVKTVTMPGSNPLVLINIRHADGTSNCAVLDSSKFMQLTALMYDASCEAATLSHQAAEATVQ
ncbi:hypothetical protein IP68_02350 [Blastomonas sp. AAP25]|uniref:hypothetical protein n=1 Tax=Blastomonas sp. AAP25 TaxID=1523416 RepID=UPI0006B92A94|nr:hypothetical protein [Blastomonas sp. AAP25]KPF76755.1 hypothetical protein IP68_02350 [Blastomonas sp. AAP25]